MIYIFLNNTIKHSNTTFTTMKRIGYTIVHNSNTTISCWFIRRSRLSFRNIIIIREFIYMHTKNTEWLILSVHLKEITRTRTTNIELLSNVSFFFYINIYIQTNISPRHTLSVYRILGLCWQDTTVYFYYTLNLADTL